MPSNNKTNCAPICKSQPERLSTSNLNATKLRESICRPINCGVDGAAAVVVAAVTSVEKEESTAYLR